MNEKEDPEEKKSGFFLKIKKSFRFGKKPEDKQSVSTSIAGKSQTSSKSLKYVNLIPAHRNKKQNKYKDDNVNHVSEEGEAPQLVNVIDQVSTSSGPKGSAADIRLDVGNTGMSGTISRGDSRQTIDEEEEQLRLYREMHEIRKQMILKEKQFEEEKLEFYKLQLEADNIMGQHKIKE